MPDLYHCASHFLFIKSANFVISVNKVPVGCRSSKECKNEASCIEGKCAKVEAFAARARKIGKVKKKRGGKRSLTINSTPANDVNEDTAHRGVVGEPELTYVDSEL